MNTIILIDNTEDELLSLEEAYKEELKTFDKFEENITHYLLYDSRADENCFRLWKAFEQDIAAATSTDIMLDNKVCLITWLKENWGAFLECILNNEFTYMNVASIVLESWEEFCD